MSKHAADELDPAIVLANDYVFGAGQVVEHRRVETRMLLMCRRGQGRVSVRWGDQSVTELFKAGVTMMLPWGHRVRYEAAADDPMVVAGVHVIPNLAPGRFERGAEHGRGGPLAGVAWRRDVPIAALDRVVRLPEACPRGLIGLVDYCVWLFRQEVVPERCARDAGRCQLDAWLQALRLPGDDVPPRLGQLLAWIDTRLDQTIRVSDLADVADCSEATVTRWFHKYQNMSPVHYLQQERIGLAQQLLTSTSLPIADIGPRVGIPQPEYFYRLFRRATGISPSAYRKRGSLL